MSERRGLPSIDRLRQMEAAPCYQVISSYINLSGWMCGTSLSLFREKLANVLRAAKGKVCRRPGCLKQYSIQFGLRLTAHELTMLYPLACPYMHGTESTD